MAVLSLPHWLAHALPYQCGHGGLQVGSADDRSGALKLCAVAAAGGFDCIPIPIS